MEILTWLTKSNTELPSFIPMVQQIYMMSYVSFTTPLPSQSPLDCILCLLSTSSAAGSNANASHCPHKQAGTKP